MSWAFGLIGRQSRNIKPDLQTDLMIDTPNLSLFAGGPSQTCQIAPDCTADRGWIELGLGISDHNNTYQILTASGWDRYLNYPDFTPLQIDGHFCIIQWDQNQLRIVTDCLGIRDVYIRQLDDGFIFSTRLDLLAEQFPLEMDFRIFGSRWLLYNQLSTQSFIRNWKRISSGEEISICRKTLKMKSRQHIWHADQEKVFTVDQYEETLKRLIRCPLNQNMPLSLSLSGGLDSRVLLALMDRDSTGLYNSEKNDR